MPGSELMEDDVAKLHAAVGSLSTQVSGLLGKFDELKQDFADLKDSTVTEHRKVHDIVVAQSEAVRNLDRDVREMKPYAEDYKMKSEKLEEAIAAARDYRIAQAEERGAEKLKKWIYGLIASVSALGAVVAGKIFDRIMAVIGSPPPGPPPPHP